MITDNALVAFECIHYIQKEKDPNKSFCAYKLDLSKAYDKVDWIFLERMILKMGIYRCWMNWIMTCVTLMRYTVKFNGTLLNSFASSCGLRQGDPSLHFFGLSPLLKDGEEKGHFTPLQVCRRAPGVYHLLFADDTLLFFKGEEQQAKNVHDELNVYERATGQCINPAKCSALFGESCSMDKQDSVRTAYK